MAGRQLLRRLVALLPKGPETIVTERRPVAQCLALLANAPEMSLRRGAFQMLRRLIAIEALEQSIQDEAKAATTPSEPAVASGAWARVRQGARQGAGSRIRSLNIVLTWWTQMRPWSNRWRRPGVRRLRRRICRRRWQAFWASHGSCVAPTASPVALG